MSPHSESDNVSVGSFVAAATNASGVHAGARVGHDAAAIPLTPSRRGTSRRRSGLVAETLAASRGPSARLLTMGLDSDQPIAQRRSPRSEGDESPRRGGHCREHSNHLQRTDQQSVPTAHFAPPH